MKSEIKTLIIGAAAIYVIVLITYISINTNVSDKPVPFAVAIPKPITKPIFTQEKKDCVDCMLKVCSEDLMDCWKAEGCDEASLRMMDCKDKNKNCIDNCYNNLSMQSVMALEISTSCKIAFCPTQCFKHK